jgi:hypothetical protein
LLVSFVLSSLLVFVSLDFVMLSFCVSFAGHLKQTNFFVVVNGGQRNNMHFFLFLLWFNMHVAWRTKF